MEITLFSDVNHSTLYLFLIAKLLSKVNRYVSIACLMDVPIILLHRVLYYVRICSPLPVNGSPSLKPVSKSQPTLCNNRIHHLQHALPVITSHVSAKLVTSIFGTAAIKIQDTSRCFKIVRALFWIQDPMYHSSQKNVLVKCLCLLNDFSRSSGGSSMGAHEPSGIIKETKNYFIVRKNK